MTREDIIRLREQADDWAEQHLQCQGEYHPDFHTVSDEHFAALVAVAEREACAKVCEQLYADGFGINCCAEAIRARGQE